MGCTATLAGLTTVLRLVVAQVLADVVAESRYQLWQLFGEDALRYA